MKTKCCRKVSKHSYLYIRLYIFICVWILIRFPLALPTNSADFPNRLSLCLHYIKTITTISCVPLILDRLDASLELSVVHFPCIYTDLYTLSCVCKHAMRKIIQLSYSNQRFCSLLLAFNVFTIECHLIMRFTYGAVINYFDYNTAW